MFPRCRTLEEKETLPNNLQYRRRKVFVSAPAPGEPLWDTKGSAPEVTTSGCTTVHWRNLKFPFTLERETHRHTNKYWVSLHKKLIHNVLL